MIARQTSLSFGLDSLLLLLGFLQIERERAVEGEEEEEEEEEEKGCCREKGLLIFALRIERVCAGGPLI